MTARLSLLLGRYGGQDEPGLLAAREAADGSWLVEPVAPSLRNISHGVWSPRHRRLYAVSEEEAGRVTVVAPEQDWRPLQSLSTHGSEPCHCALDGSEGFLAVANYGSGDVTVFALGEDGLLGSDPWRHRGEGSGPDPERQDGPHAHWVGFAPDQRHLIQADLGADAVLAFPFDAGRGVGGHAETAFAAPPGSGPRWLNFGPDGEVLLVTELASTLSLCGWSEGRLAERDRRSTRAPGATGDNAAGHIAVNAARTRCYVTNRGDDTVAVFAIEQGRLVYKAAVPSGGKSPRYLHLAEERGLLFVGHEEEGPVTIFDLSGQPRPCGAIPAENVAWIAPLPA